MTVQDGAVEANVKIRAGRHDWVWLFGFGGFLVAFAAFGRITAELSSVMPLVVGCVFVAEALLIRTFGVDLTPECANTRGLRRRSIPWSQVQAVLNHRQLGTMRVSLVLESGQRVTLRAPSTWWGLGSTEYGVDFDRIGHWWLDHRGELWRPVRHEAPRP